MYYVGVDIGKSKHAAVAVDEMGACVMPARFFTQDVGGYASLFGALAKLGDPSSIVIGMEATGHYWKVLRAHCSVNNYRVDVINPLITSREASADVRGRKSDKIDALAIANVLRKGQYNSAPVDSVDNDTLKSLTRQRKGLVERSTAAKLSLASSLDVLFVEAAKTLGDLYSATALAVIAAYPSARLVAAANISKLTSLFRKASSGQLARKEAEEYQKAAKSSLSLRICNEGEEFVVRQTIAEIHAFATQIREVETRMFGEPPPDLATALSSIKGAGKIQPLVIAAELGDLSRFKGRDMAKKILAFAGSEPRIRESGKWKGKVKMSKRGSPYLRNALYVMAGTVWVHTPYFRAVYEAQKAKGKHHNVALSHVVRKIILVMCGMCNNQTLFAPPVTEAKTC